MKCNKPLFSVIIPTYNRASLLRRCLNSLVQQTYKDFEVLVCDDGSIDESRGVAESFRDKLMLQYIWGEHWGTPGRPRNNGIKIAKGYWICFLDSDDWWMPEKLASCVPYLDKHDLIYHSLKIVYANGKNTSRIICARAFKNDIKRDLLLNGNGIPNSSVVLRKSIIDLAGPIDEDYEIVEDFDYWIRIAEHTNRFFCLNKILGYYWIDKNISISLKQIDRVASLYNKHKNSVINKDTQFISEIINYTNARIYHRNGCFREAILHYNSLFFSRFIVKAIIGILLCLIHYRY